VNNNQFLDDIERRAINGDVFHADEINHLRALAVGPVGHAFDVTEPMYMRGAAQQHVTAARKRLVEAVLARLTDTVAPSQFATTRNRIMNQNFWGAEL